MVSVHSRAGGKHDFQTCYINTSSKDQSRSQLALCLGADLGTLEWVPGAPLWSEAGEDAQDSL